MKFESHHHKKINKKWIIAGVITVGFFILTWFLPQFSTVFTNFSLINMFSKFPSGQIDIADNNVLITYCNSYAKKKKCKIGGKNFERE